MALMAKKSFQKLTVVRLVSAPNPPPDSPEDAAIQAAHIRYLTGLVEQGTILVNGPVKRVDSEDVRGMSLYLVGAEEARALAEADPAVRAGWFRIVVDEWLVPVRPRQIADRSDLELDVPE